jgi:hypothetical protein
MLKMKCIVAIGLIATTFLGANAFATNPTDPTDPNRIYTSATCPSSTGGVTYLCCSIITADVKRSTTVEEAFYPVKKCGKNGAGEAQLCTDHTSFVEKTGNSTSSWKPINPQPSHCKYNK